MVGRDECDSDQQSFYITDAAATDSVGLSRRTHLNGHRLQTGQLLIPYLRQEGTFPIPEHCQNARADYGSSYERHDDAILKQLGISASACPFCWSAQSSVWPVGTAPATMIVISHRTARFRVGSGPKKPALIFTLRKVNALETFKSRMLILNGLANKCAVMGQPIAG